MRSPSPRGMLPRAVALVALAALSLGGRGLGAQGKRPSEPRPIVVRVGGMRDAAVCLCKNDGQPTPHDRDLFTVSIGTEWTLAAMGPFHLSYAADFLPLVLSENTGDAALSVWSCGPGHYCGHADSPYPWNTAAVGVGLLPAGLVARLRVAPVLALRARVSGGAVYMSRPVPVMQSRNLNFMAELAAGAELRIWRNLAMSVGVTQNHISNGNTAPVNLGMDTRLLELGLVLAR